LEWQISSTFLVPRPLLKPYSSKSPKTEEKNGPNLPQVKLNWNSRGDGQTEVAQKRSREICHSKHTIVGLNKDCVKPINRVKGVKDGLNRTLKIDIGLDACSVLAGLVAVTGPCAVVDGWAACLIGLVSSVALPNGV
jgi:hypothetical protein